MAVDVKEWQHVNPVDTHPAKPPFDAANLGVGFRAKCGTCKRTIAVFPPNEGPEALKSLMRLR